MINNKYKIYPRSKVEKLVTDFIEEHKIYAEECPPYFEGLMYFRFVVEEEHEDEAGDKALYGDYLDEDDQGCEMGSQVVCDIEEYEE